MHNTVNVLNATGLFALKDYVMCILPQFKKRTLHAEVYEI